MISLIAITEATLSATTAIQNPAAMPMLDLASQYTAF
jgi:hypothetical protein